jgi:hypothetical protein
MALDFDQIAATTLKNYRKTLTDNIFNEHPVLFHFKDKGRVRFLDGGEKIIEPLIHTVGDTPAADGGNLTDGSYGEWDDITITPVQTATAASYDWKMIAGTVAISGLQEAKNSGKEQVINLLEAKLMQAEETLKGNLATAMFASALAETTSPMSLRLLVDDTYDAGGIDCSVETWWKSTVQDATAIAAADVDLRALVRTNYNTASKGGSDRVDLVVSGQDAFEQYEADLLPTVRRTNTKMTDAGFQNLEVQGVPWVWDYLYTDPEIMGINSKYVGLVGHKNRWFKQSKFTDGLATAQGNNGGTASVIDAKYAVITSYLEFTCRNRRRNFKITNLNLS